MSKQWIYNMTIVYEKKKEQFLSLTAINIIIIGIKTNRTLATTVETKFWPTLKIRNASAVQLFY